MSVTVLYFRLWLLCCYLNAFPCVTCIFPDQVPPTPQPQTTVTAISTCSTTAPGQTG